MPATGSAPGLAVEELFAEQPRPLRIDGVVVATLAGFDDGGAPRVAFVGNPLHRQVSARSTVCLTQADLGSDLAVSFVDGDPARPIVLGKLWQPDAPVSGRIEPDVDGERLVLTAKQEIVLQCGAASLTLTRAGKIVLRGEYIVSRSAGVNRIKGGSVQIN